jgi:formate hydrogenlyase subunit 3/multisubunit Na+/H+ antiporter MnhD subunit
MDFLLILPVVLSLLILIISSKLRYYFALFITLYVSVISSIPAISLLINFGSTPFVFYIFSTEIIIDNLSAFFMIVTNFTMLTGMLFSKGYLQPYLSKKSSYEIAIHYCNYLLLHVSMLLVLVFRNGFAFLIAWELMAVSSFILILFEGEKRSTLKTAVNYLIQMHIGFVFLLIAFLICQSETGNISFDALKIYFANHNNSFLFMMFFVGFAIKAGFIPLHTWLPDAHPAAPSHVSGTMSGVMIKMGIYGIIRVLSYVHFDLYLIGFFILLISAISGILGVMFAIIQHDLKKLLAYHSIENIGIIGMGIGLGTIGLGINNPLLVMLGFSGALLHVLNHSLFKSLLFYSAGSVYKNYHTHNIEQLGGVIHKMPKTAAFFLIGSIAICGLPPLNGFISEFLIYLGLFKGLTTGTFHNSILMLLAIIALVLIGGLAIFCFTKVFSVVFLGTSRKKMENEVNEVGNDMLFPQLLISLAIIAIGLFPMIFIKPITIIVSGLFKINTDSYILSITDTFSKIGIISITLIVITGSLIILRSKMLKKRKVNYGTTWGCGSANISGKQQYTGSSFANNFSDIARPLLHIKKEYNQISENEIFPAKRSFYTHPEDVFKKTILKIVDFLMMILKKLARLQTGQIQHYILYAFIFILLIFILMYLKFI